MIEIRKKITLKSARCPKCQTKRSLKKILWGMPSMEDQDKYILGGCCIPENPPEIGCRKCGWQGWRGSLIPENRVIRESKITEHE